MSHACTPILMGVTSPISEILQLLKTAKFPLLTMDYSPWSSKSLIDQNRLKKFMQIRIDVTYICTNFGGRDLSSFGDIATLKNGQISLSDHGLYSPWSLKNLIDRNWLKKFMHIRIDVTCMRTNFGGRGLSIFGVMASFCLPSKTAKISLQTMGYSPWSSKNLIDRNRPKKFMQVGIDVTCMHTNFDGRDLSSFGDIATFKNGQICPSDHGL